MLHRVTRIQGLPVGATDGAVGSIDDLYFDEARWGVRFLAVDTGGRLAGRKVLISPRSIRHGEWSDDAVRVDLSRTQIEGSPAPDAAGPVSRDYEMAHAAYYSHPPYWSGPYLWGPGAYPLVHGGRHPPHDAEARALELAAAEAQRAAAPAPPLRSSAALIGCGVEARDGAVGHVDDLLVDDETWGIPYFVVDKRAWLPGGQVLVLPDAVHDIDWVSGIVRLTMTRAAVHECPPYH